ncbi:hypothetical protein ACS0TY_016664 [Phlomoides rotata]
MFHVIFFLRVSILFSCILMIYCTFQGWSHVLAKLHDERFIFPSSLTSDFVRCIDIIMTKQLLNEACHSILFKLIKTLL